MEWSQWHKVLPTEYTVILVLFFWQILTVFQTQVSHFAPHPKLPLSTNIHGMTTKMPENDASYCILNIVLFWFRFPDRFCQSFKFSVSFFPTSQVAPIYPIFMEWPQWLMVLHTEHGVILIQISRQILSVFHTQCPTLPHIPSCLCLSHMHGMTTQMQGTAYWAWCHFHSDFVSVSNSVSHFTQHPSAAYGA